jgi:tryptophan-rich sensory protein
VDVSFLVFLGLSFVAASSGAVFRPGEWYENLRKPGWRPPNYAFPIVWSVLYLLLAIAAWRVWERATDETVWPAMTAYGIQLVLNAAWSALFFGMRRMRLAFAELVLLWLSILAMMVTFQPVDDVAVLLLAPYLAWVSVAGLLNWTMIRLNPAPEGAR